MNSFWEKINESLESWDRSDFNQWRDHLNGLAEDLLKIADNKSVLADDRVAAMSLILELAKIPVLQEPQGNGKLLPLRTAALKCGLQSSWLKEKAIAGEIPCLRSGSRFLFRESDIKAALENMASSHSTLTPKTPKRT
jgi:hypothetical protein